MYIYNKNKTSKFTKKFGETCIHPRFEYSCIIVHQICSVKGAIFFDVAF